MTAFSARHIGTTPADQRRMLRDLGVTRAEGPASAAVLAREALPAQIVDEALALPPALGEAEVLAELRRRADRIRLSTPMIGLGYHDTVMPSVIRRCVLENPAWYTAYTPYQPEISQGRLELLFTFQTMICDLTGLAVAQASLLDEATAAAEAMTVTRRATRRGETFLVDPAVLPQTLAVLRTRATPVGITIRVEDPATADLDDVFGVLVQQPGADGVVRDLRPLVERVHAAGALVVAAADLLALTLLRPPGEDGADVCVGSTQRFGVPLGFGGPHAGYLSLTDELKRQIPGRLVGLSRDAQGRPAYRLALQTREQHIRREKATSNVCTAQVLPAILATLYAVYHGPQGLTEIARQVHGHALVLAAAAGVTDPVFDTVVIPCAASTVFEVLRSRDITVGVVGDDAIRVACDERTTTGHIEAILEATGLARVDVTELPEDLLRHSSFLTSEAFHAYRSETALMRWLRRLADRDLALDRTMIPLGSCTMKLNSATEMTALTWPEIGGLHPFAPLADAEGLLSIVSDLEGWLCEITGYDAVSLQPNAGSQGELAGLLAIHAHHGALGQSGRDICLIPASAHGTNAASAVMAGLRVIVVACTQDGAVDLADLRRLVALHREELSCVMVTYPSTHGVYEDSISELCALVHDAGGQVYVDGANLNALVGLARPGRFGADVSHLNLHKTFCIPHGGGGPGVGPVAVRAHLAPYLPGHPAVPGLGTAVGPVSAAPWGSASLLVIPWAYIRLMGPDGLQEATRAAVLAANWLAAQLEPYFPVLYRGEDGRVAHECILDLRPLTRDAGVSVDDVAKRLVDYGFHAPTVSFPVAGTLMVEPTESEDLIELRRFVDAMVGIHAEAMLVQQGHWPLADNPLSNAPHTADVLMADTWERPYPRTVAGAPQGSRRADKYWPPVGRIDGAFGDRNLVCSCPPLHELAES
jgi:glycine dehydrogenase